MVPTTMADRSAPEYTTLGQRIQDRNWTGSASGRLPRGYPRARAGPGLRGQDRIPDALSEATGVGSGGVRMPCPAGVDLQELGTELPLQLAAASGRWPRRASRKRGHEEGLNQRCLAATVQVSHFMQRRLESEQCAAGRFKGITDALVEPGEANDPTRGLELRVECLELDRGRELPIDRPRSATTRSTSSPIGRRAPGSSGVCA